jgi:hypothetical protein
VRSQLNGRTLGALPSNEVYLDVIVRRVEIHDAVLRAEMQGSDLVLILDPIFVQHWERLAGRVEGLGRWQGAQIRISRGRWLAPPAEDPILLQGGRIQVGDERFDDLIPFPLEATGAVKGVFIPRDNSPRSLEFAGTSMTLALTGEPRGAEPLPAEWAPSNLI